MLVGRHPDDQAIALDTGAHVAIEQKAIAAEHLLAGQAGLAGEDLADPVGEPFIEGHFRQTRGSEARCGP